MKSSAAYTERATGRGVTLSSLFIWTPYITFRVLRWDDNPPVDPPVVTLVELETGIQVKAHQFHAWPGTVPVSGLEYPSGRTYGMPNFELAKYFSGAPLDEYDIPAGAPLSIPYALSEQLFELKLPCDYVIQEAYGSVDDRPLIAQAGLLASIFSLD